ncbi:hypothetical protein MTO96_036069 [Rhipicephalus appendiculatus]
MLIITITEISHAWIYYEWCSAREPNYGMHDQIERIMTVLSTLRMTSNSQIMCAIAWAWARNSQWNRGSHASLSGSAALKPFTDE